MKLLKTKATLGRLIGVGIITFFFSVTLTASTAVAETAAANTAGCYGSGCTGKDPTGLCDGDAYTVASMEVNTVLGYAGQLDLRYSPSCAANWGRFTPALRPSEFLRFALGMSVPYAGRLTVWNPGERSQGFVERTPAPWELTDWTKMVDGTKTACTGVEVIYSTGREPGYGGESTGWNWGPCA